MRIIKVGECEGRACRIVSITAKDLLTRPARFAYSGSLLMNSRSESRAGAFVRSHIIISHVPLVKDSFTEDLWTRPYVLHKILMWEANRGTSRTTGHQQKPRHKSSRWKAIHRFSRTQKTPRNAKTKIHKLLRWITMLITYVSNK